MQDRRARARRTLRSLAHVFERGTCGRLRARDTLRPYSPIPRLRNRAFFVFAPRRLVCRHETTRRNRPNRHETPRGSLQIATKSTESTRRDRIDATESTESARNAKRKSANRDETTRRNRQDARQFGDPPTLFCRASGIRSSFSQFFCPPLRIFTKVL